VSLTGIEVGQAAVAVLAVLVICGEYSTGMIRVTLTATPRRWMVLAAKAAVLTGLVLAVAVVAVAILNTTGLRNLVISPWAGLGVLAAWAAGALILGGLVLRFRDA
jgi:ABC-2 type transport system permease protein